MKRLLFCALMSAALVAVLTAFERPAEAQTQQQQTASSGTAAGATGGGAINVEAIVRAFTAKETEFRKALSQYSFKRDAVIQTIGLGGQISGEYRRVSRFVFDDSGNRYEKILFFPMSTISEVTITPEDLEDLGGIQPFALEASKIHLYNFNYVGKERLDEIDTYIFDVGPKANLQDPKIAKQYIKNKERFFQGRIWVDTQDLQIVKSRGKGVPEDKNNKYVTFETYREQIDGRYWFPTYTYGDDELVFDNGQAVHMRMRVKYDNFEKLTGKVRVIDEGEPDAVPSPSPTPAPPKKP